MPKTVKTLSKPEQYVLARRNADALYATMTPEERTEADEGMGWAEVLAYGSSNGGARRGPGRPKGSKAKPKSVDVPPTISDPQIRAEILEAEKVHG